MSLATLIQKANDRRYPKGDKRGGQFAPKGSLGSAFAHAAKVSEYAGKNGHEFAAEVFAAVRAGRKLDDDVMTYYGHIGGPTP